VDVLRKNRSGNTAVVADQDLRQRVDKAISERRYQTALDLAKQLYRYEATPEHRELLFQVYLGRAEQLREQGRTKDAVTVLGNAQALADGQPERWRRLADAFASCGDISRAQSALANVPGGQIDPAVFGRAADAAMQQGAAGRAQLPEPIRAEFDRIRTAFAQLQAGNDDAVREVLQGIGLQSPFLEWKVLLRGFVAYYRDDDERALENWQRLDRERLPARLAAPFRFQIDAAYRQAQAAEATKALQSQLERLRSSAILSCLRNIQSSFLKHANLNAAFRDAEKLVPLMLQQAPQLLPRLANVFYWQIIERGQPPDVLRYERLFGRPDDDPNFYRLDSLVLEQMPDYAHANTGWKKFQEDVAANGVIWPNSEADRARAMIWYRMGVNAEKQDQIVESTRNLPPITFFREADKPARLKPSAADCYRKAAALAPDWLDPHWQLFDMLRAKGGKLAAALKAGNELLALFPEHLPTLEAMADLQSNSGNFDAAAQLLERAMHVNSLDRTVTSRLSDLYRLRGVKQFAEDHFEEGRSSLQAALGLADGAQQFAVCCQWAAGEFRAGNLEQAEALIQKAAAIEAERPALSALLFAHCVQWKLPKVIKARFEKPFQEQLKQTSATAAEAVALAALFGRFQREHWQYFGQKTHQKKVLTLIEKSLASKYTEPQMQQLGKHLLALRAIRLLRKFNRVWEQRFPKSPYPRLFEVESYLSGDSDHWPLWKLGPLLQKAKDLAEKLPPSEERDEMLKLIENRQQQFHDLNPFASFFDSIMDEFDEEDFDDEDEGDDLW
jgi:tetratricopeptide (TPR) repeat protein